MTIGKFGLAFGYSYSGTYFSVDLVSSWEARSVGVLKIDRGNGASIEGVHSILVSSGTGTGTDVDNNSVFFSII